MSIVTWADLKVAAQSRKVAIVKIVPKELLDVIWTLESRHADVNVYSTPLDTFHGSDIQDIEKDGTIMVRAVSAAALETLPADEFYYDITNEKLWINVTENSTTIDSCEVTTGWVAVNAPNETLDAVNFKEGANSLNLGKSGGGVFGSYEKTEASTIDATDKWGGLWFYVKDKTEFTELRFFIGSDAFNFFSIDFFPAGLTDNDADGDPWNDIVALSGVPLVDWPLGLGSPDITAIDYLAVRIRTAGAADTIVLGNLKMDFWRTVDDENPYGSDYVVNHLMYFSNDATFRIAIPTGVATIVPDDRLDSVPVIKHSNKGALLGLNLPAKASFKLNNLDGLLDTWYNELEWTDSDVTVYLGGEDLPFSEYQIIYTGRMVNGIVGKAVTWSRDSLTIKIEDRRNRALQDNFFTATTIGFTDFEGDFIGQDHNWRGKSPPRQYGRQLSQVPILLLNTGYILASSIDDSQLTLRLVANQEPGQPLTLPPQSGTMIIDGEKITYSSIDLATNIVRLSARAASDTNNSAHTAGAAIRIVEATGINLIRGNHFGGIATSIADFGEVWYNDIVAPWQAGGALYQFGDISNSPILEPGKNIVADALKSGGNEYGTMIKLFLNDVGIPDAELNVASFAALDAAINNSDPGYFFDWDDTGAKALNMMLQSAQAWIVTDSDGKLEVRHFDPVIDESALIDLTDSDIQSWKPQWDAKRIRTQIKVLYKRQWALSGEKEWASSKGTNAFNGIIPVEKKELKLETAEYNITYADELKDHLMAMSAFKQERVKLSVLPLRFAEARPGDRIRVNLDRPWNNVDRIFEIDSVKITIKKGGLDIALDVHNIYGLDDRVGGWTEDAAPTWSASTDTDKIEHGFWCDDNGFIDPADATTKNRKVWY